MIAGIYKAPGIDEIDVLDDVFAEITPSYSDVIIAGDFNENLQTDSLCRCLTCKLRSCSACKLK